ncbi:MAG: hypothetical protein AB7Q17_08565, partial [Phycisphaerae bacterium]
GGRRCVVVTREMCDRANGEYRGDGTLCGPDACGPPPVLGACCLPDGHCIVTTADRCTALRGMYRGDNTDCDSGDRCPEPPGACCVRSDVGIECVVLTLRQCTERHGLWRGPNTNCDTPCPTPPAVGACCVADPNGGRRCVVVTREMCDRANGEYRGDGTRCENTDCRSGGIVGERGDGLGATKAEDAILDYLDAFFAGDGDLNRDGRTDAFDLVELLESLEANGG